jgi:hypothetical protein
MFSLTNTSTVGGSSALLAQGHTFGISGSGGAGGAGVFGSGGSNASGVWGEGGGNHAGVLAIGGATDGTGLSAAGTASGLTDHAVSGNGVLARGAAANPSMHVVTLGGDGVQAFGGNDSRTPPSPGLAGAGGTGLLAGGGAGTNGNYGGIGINTAGGSGTKGGGTGILAFSGAGPGGLAGDFRGDVRVTGALLVETPRPLAFQNLALLNGWTGGPAGTAVPGIAEDAQGIVHFRGAMSNSGTFNANAFVVAAQYRPSHTVFVTVDMCNATTGRIEIRANGNVLAEDTASGVNAKCFTSLDGVTYALG